MILPRFKINIMSSYFIFQHLSNARSGRRILQAKTRVATQNAQGRL
jgi:hypothetical protein